MLILNIGLETTHGGKLDPRATFTAIAGRAPGAVHCGVHASDSEPTLVVIVPDLNPLALLRLAEQFAQDCIAVYDPRTKRGRLIGPRAAAWGTFTPEYFIMPDGARLATPMQALAAIDDAQGFV